MKVYDTIARTDRSAVVRCAAIAAMTPRGGPRQVPTALKLLSSKDVTAPETRMAPASVRWEAAKLLDAIVARYDYQESQRPLIVRTLLDCLSRDPDRQVRLSAIGTLAYFAEAPVPQALIDVLDEEDFAFRHAAEMSLVDLTGMTHDYDSRRWRAWLESTDDPFERAGATPESMQEKQTSWNWGWE
jgi:HEAT repeat protein